MYILMNKDSQVAEFERSKDQLDGGFTMISAKKEKLPIGFQDINIWLDKRQAAKHREHLRRLMAQCGCLNSEGFIKITHAASLNDTFWVKTSDENVVWDDISLYKNEFNEVISKISFEGNGLFGIDFSTTTPEFSTEGSFEKCWNTMKASDRKMHSAEWWFLMQLLSILTDIWEIMVSFLTQTLWR